MRPRAAPRSSFVPVRHVMLSSLRGAAAVSCGGVPISVRNAHNLDPLSVSLNFLEKSVVILPSGRHVATLGQSWTGVRNE